MSQRPNILLLLSDQQRWDTLGCYGQRLPISPNLDALARRGTLFRYAFSNQPVCGPARAMIQTGLYPTQNDTFTNARGLPVGARTMADDLNDAGYQTGYVGKWHLSEIYRVRHYRTEAIPPDRRGGYKDWWVASDVLEFTSHSYDGFMYDAEGNKVFIPEGRYRADFVTDQALRFIEEARDKQRPFFLMVSYIEPHHQNDHERFEGPVGSRERWADFDVPGDLAGTDGDWQEHMPDYLGCCHSLDQNVGRFIAALERQGILDNTVIIYTSDHGCHFRTRNPEYKRSCHDGCTRIPMIAAGPGFDGRGEVRELVSLIDLPVTVLAAAGIEKPAQMHGRALQEAGDGEGEVFIQISEDSLGRALRTPRWKYCVFAPDADPWQQKDSPEYIEQYLYDLEADPHERCNLVVDPAYADIRAQLAARLLARMAEAQEPPAVILPAPPEGIEELMKRSKGHC